jgi:dienelactone hydrolase
LLTAEEQAVDSESHELRDDLSLLAGRAEATLDWVSREPELRPLPVGVFGASTGAAAALVAASRRPELVLAVVSRGGRPDLADAALSAVRTPTLLIVGSEDHAVLELNQLAATRLRAPHRLEVVAGAGHLFQEPGSLEQVSELAAHFFGSLLTPKAPRLD